MQLSENPWADRRHYWNVRRSEGFRAHDIPSNTAIAIRNMSASEIRYAVIHMPPSSKEKCAA
jgi:hypothetical protein